MAREGEWTWSSSLQPVGDFVWYAYQPNGGTVQNCLRLSYGYAYRGDDYICENQYATICQLNIWINSYVDVILKTKKK